MTEQLLTPAEVSDKMLSDAPYYLTLADGTVIFVGNAVFEMNDTPPDVSIHKKDETLFEAICKRCGSEYTLRDGTKVVLGSCGSGAYPTKIEHL